MEPSTMFIRRDGSTINVKLPESWHDIIDAETGLVSISHTASEFSSTTHPVQWTHTVVLAKGVVLHHRSHFGCQMSPVVFIWRVKTGEGKNTTQGWVVGELYWQLSTYQLRGGLDILQSKKKDVRTLTESTRHKSIKCWWKRILQDI